MRKVWNFQEQIALCVVERVGTLGETGNLLTDLSDFGFKFFARFLTRTSRADLFTQSIALGL